PGMGIYLPM
uniref:Cyclopeptide F n=1 Tax=Annona cherimola TaxID=49314 RepID=CYCLF_ANNCH|nr:RecName: Full=Cyclopeptide F [Annona cherimola]